MTLTAGVTHGLLKGLTSFIHPRIPPTRDAAECEVLEAAVTEVLESQLSQGGIIQADNWQRQIRERNPQIDRGQSRLTHGPGHGAVFDANQNAVPLPHLQPVRGSSFQSLWLK